MEHIKICAVDIRDFDPEQPSIRQYFPPERLCKIDALVNKNAKRLSAGAHLAFSVLRNDEFPISDYSYTKTGKPYIIDKNAYISFSHSHNLAICAVSDSDMAVDTEKIRNINKLVYKTVLTPKEIQSTSISNMTDEYLINKWCVKESYLKLASINVRKYTMTKIHQSGNMVFANDYMPAYLNEVRLFIGEDEYLIKTASYSKKGIELVYYTAKDVLKHLRKVYA